MVVIIMSNLILNPISAIDKLIKHGFKRQQAKGIVDTLQELDLSNLATKQDVNNVKTELQSDIKDLRVETMTMKSEILKWLIPILIGQFSVTVVIVLRLMG